MNELQLSNFEPTKDSRLIRFVEFMGKYYKKSSILWLLIKKKSVVSTDRQFRFICDKNEKVSEKMLYTGKYAAFLLDTKMVVCYILGFKYLSGKRTTYTLEYCPVSTDKEGQGIGVLATYYILENNALVGLKNENLKYFNIDNFYCHVNVIHLDGKFICDDPSMEKMNNILCQINYN